MEDTRQKPKGESLHTVLNLMLLARSFDLETHQTTEASAQRIEDMHQPYHLLKLDMARRITTEVASADDAYDFSVAVRRRSRGVDLTTVRARGRILYSEGLDATLIRGHIRLGWFFLVSTFGAMLFIGGLLLGIIMLDQAPAVALIVYMGIVGPLSLWLGWLVRKDYRLLAAHFAEALVADEVRRGTAGGLSSV